MASKSTDPTPKPTSKVFAPSGKAPKAAATATAKAPVLDVCPGAGFVCDGGKYIFTGKGTHFACSGTGQFDVARKYVTTVREQTQANAKGDLLFDEWAAHMKANRPEITVVLSKGK